MEYIYKKILEKLYEKNIITNKNHLCFKYNKKIKNDLLKEIYNATYFLNENYDLKSRIWSIANNITKTPVCKVCGSPTKFIKNFTDGFFQKYCGRSCSRKDNNPLINKTEEEKASIYKKIGRKNRFFSEKWRKNMSLAAKKPSVQEAKKKTNLIKYGVENPGVLGAYSSKESFNMINRIFLKVFKEEQCQYACKGKREFFVNIDNNVVAYDLVIFNNKIRYHHRNPDDYVLFFEYNGPWHYEEFEIQGHENEQATPYVTNTSKKKLTKLQTFKQDNIKKDFAIKNSLCFITYWSKRKIFEIWFDNKLSWMNENELTDFLVKTFGKKEGI